MDDKKNTLWPEDEKLFSTMKGNYVSANERIFFETMRRKEESEISISNDLILSEVSNDDHLYIERCNYDEYVIGHVRHGKYDKETHVMNLSQALVVNLKDAGYLEESISLLGWLRKRDYKGVMYDHNYDLL